ncbi:DNA-binding domain-containing protein, AraC-type [Shewanella psychrophila]|uniref:DNA-binding domain-containing protein, AraC-type n=1 Tax=Shewanella psychrophila TaxID=225848 RepID=A0A1S6HYI4_9GAMM|nr:AraC family transcriptional regulator [Shewanella psychrophila]AQS40656.1 DNA-binding domain-containing protein, AraC-type [Shewanella psychrophila]
MFFSHTLQIVEAQEKAPFHCHNSAQLVYVHIGCQVIYTRVSSILALAGQLIWLPQNVEHKAEGLKHSTLSLMYSTDADMMNLGDSICSLELTPLIIQIMSMKKNGLLPNGSKTQLHYDWVLKDQIARTSPSASMMTSKGELDRRLLPVINALTKVPNIKIQLDEYAETCGASTRTLNRLFKQHFQCSFRDVRSRVVMEKAKQLQRDGQQATQIAFELGYASLSAYSAAFHAYRRSTYENLE